MPINDKIKIPLYYILAADLNGAIGKNGDLPWSIKDDMNYFHWVSSGLNRSGDISEPRNAVIMGRKTWESMPDSMRPLENRLNVVVTRNSAWKEQNSRNLLVHLDLQSALKEIAARDDVELIFCIGGSYLYNECLEYCSKIFYTEIRYRFDDCDTFFHLPSTGFTLQPTQKMDDFFEKLKLYYGIQGKRKRTDPLTGIEYEFLIYDRD